MTVLNVQDAKARLSELIRRALDGEEILIARRNRPVIRLQSLAVENRQRKIGTWKGAIEMADDFDAPLADFADYT